MIADSERASNAPQSPEAMEKELAAMAEVGARRLRLRTITFIVSVVLVFAALSLTRYAGFQIGFLYRGFVAVPIAAVLAVAISKHFNAAIITDVAKKHGLAPESLAADKFLID